MSCSLPRRFATSTLARSHGLHSGSNSRKRVAFTLVELLVVIAIIGILLYLLSPAIQASRERARKAACQNHLKQLATAAQLHLNAQGYFPSGGWSGNFVADPNRGYGREQPGGWLFSLVEYIEESSLRTGAGRRRCECDSARPWSEGVLQQRTFDFLLPQPPRSESLPVQTKWQRRLVAERCS